MAEESALKKFVFKISQDKLAVSLCSVDPAGEGFKALVEAKEHLKKLDVTYGVDEAILEQKLEQLEIGEEAQVAWGKEPINGKDGFLDWKIDTDARAKFVPAEDDDDAVDYKNSMKLDLVKEGDVICIFNEATKGEEGKSVHGIQIPPTPGKPVNIILGDSVEVVDNNYKALSQGKPSFVADKISVMNVLEIPGDVDFETGNLDFPGSIIIRGGILDGFKVECSMNVEVYGVVGDATIIAGGDVICYGGISGKEACIIKGKGTCSAKYVTNANIESVGDILITKDSTHSSLNTLGTVKSQNGCIVGGVVTALRGVEAQVLGSLTGVKTYINVKMHYESEKYHLKLNALLTEYYEYYIRYAALLRSKDIPAKNFNEISKAIEALKSAIKKGRIIEEKIDGLVGETNGIESAPVQVNNTLFADVIIQAPGCHKEILETVKGKLTVLEDFQSGQMVVK
jgi:hypothetical protein